ncbi:HNH endonuclease family protein [Brachyspira hampsonii]|uniref:HNH endonuclease family protein n=1 Tax=Brachyspira hampsonii TaxID=1287055 RepID=UPI0018E5988C|nr:HNH endonuclease family protein [Brachyspira hampsonii]
MQNLDDKNVSTFIRFFLIIENKEFSKESEVYNDFKKYLENKNNEDVLKDLLKYSEYYNIILNTEKELNKNIKIKLNNIKELKINVLNPLIILLLQYRDDGYISDEILFDSLHLIENYILRRLICSKPANGLNKICISLIKKISSFFNDKINTDKFIEYIASSLIDLKGGSEFPDDLSVINSIIEKDVYKTVLGKFILTRLEGLNSKEKIDINNITIEHIMPITLNNDWIDLIGNNYKEVHKKYINTLGNLTLTAYNPELSNNHLKEKIKVYKNSKFTFLNKDLIELDDWGENIIVDRSKRLINELLKYYKYPNITIEENNDILEYPLDDSIDFSGMNIYSFEYKNVKYEASKWAKFIIKILNLIYEEDSVRFNNLIFKDDSFKNKISDEEFFL